MTTNPQPVAIDSIQLPPLCDAVVDAATLSQLAADLQQRTEVRSVQVKHGAARLVGDQVWELTAAFEALARGAVRGVQVNYRYEQHEWTDTVLRAAEGFRVVRVQHLSPAPEANP